MASLFQRKNFTLGEGILAADMVDLQDYAAKVTAEGMMLPNCQTEFSPASAAVAGGDEVVYAMGNSGWPYWLIGDTVSIKRGVIAQCHATSYPPDVDDSPELCAYSLADDEIETVHAAGALASGQGRWDIVCVDLQDATGDAENRIVKDAITGVRSSQSVDKRTVSVLTTVVVEGTIAVAASATEPAIPTGGAKLYAARYDHGQTGFSFARVRDYRMPMGYSDAFTHPIAMAPDAGWALDATKMAMLSAAASIGDGLIIPFHGPACARIVSVQVVGRFMPGAVVELGAVRWDTGAGTQLFTALRAITEPVTGSQQAHVANLSTGVPVWGQGHSCYHPAIADGSYLAIRIQAAGTADWVTGVRWHYCGG